MRPNQSKPSEYKNIQSKYLVRVSSQAYKHKDFIGKLKEVNITYRKFKRNITIGLGPINHLSLSQFRTAVQALLSTLQTHKIDNCAVIIPRLLYRIAIARHTIYQAYVEIANQSQNSHCGIL